MISTAVALAYAAPGFILALIGITFYVHLQKFYSDIVGLDVGVIGLIILCSRIFDALTDPVIGSLSDRTRSRFGRRRPWLLLGVLPLAGVFALLMNPPLAASDTTLLIWFAAGTVLFFLFWTIVSVPYEALGAELSFDYNERTRILAIRDGAVVAGTLLAAVIPEVLKYWLGGVGLRPGDLELLQYRILSIAYGVLLIAGVLICLRWVQERQWDEAQRPKGMIWSGSREIFRNRAFLILLVAYLISGLGAALPATLIAYYVEHVLGSKEWGYYLLIYFGVGFVCLPFWIRLATRIEKKTTWLLAMAINTGAFVGVFFLGRGDTFLYGVLVALSAVGYGATFALPSSMQADVIDYDEWGSGKRREGQFTGWWLIAKKLSAALGAGIALRTLGSAGYVPNVIQNEDVLFALRALYAGVPSLCNLVAMSLVLFYPITRKLHNQWRADIDARGCKN